MRVKEELLKLSKHVFIPPPSSLIPAFLEEGAGVEPTRVFQAPTVFRTAWRAHAQPSCVLAEAVGLEPTGSISPATEAGVVPYH